ncbi:MAG: thioredoxin domain-containing protein [Gemmatimonadota bacterium]
MSTRSERRREAQGKGSGSNMTRIYAILGALAVVGVGAVGYSVGRGSGSAATQPVVIEGIDEDMARLAEMAQGETKGDEDAPVTIIEFGDYMCPGCGMFNTQVKPQIELQLVQTGKAQFVFYDFPLTGMHPNSFLAARAARCAGDQGMFWEYHDNLFRNQARWSNLTNPIGLFEEYSRTLDMDDNAFSSCLNSDRHAELVTANMHLGEALRVPSTPTVLIEYEGAAQQVEPDFQSIQSHVEGLLAEADSEPDAQ